MNQREKDLEHARHNHYGAAYSAGASHFADGAEYGRKDLARRVLEPFQQNPDTEFSLWVQPIVQLCLAILQDQAPAEAETAPCRGARDLDVVMRERDELQVNLADARKLIRVLEIELAAERAARQAELAAPGELAIADRVCPTCCEGKLERVSVERCNECGDVYPGPT